MTTLKLNLRLPDNLAQEAADQGLLSPSAIAELLRSEIKRRRVDGLFAAADRLAALKLKPLSEVELETEIEAAREARRATHARRR